MPTSTASIASEQNERTSLLSRHSDPDLRSDAEQGTVPIVPGYEPPINPMNQKSARVYHVVLVLLFALALFWLSLLSVDQLISVGVGATQGSGFECFSTTLLGVAAIGLSLLFYRAPSPSDRTLSLLSAGILFVDMLIISMVDQLRRRIGPVPMLCSFGGAAIACLLSSVSDTVVDHATSEEQERLLGHTSKRRSLLEWLGVILSNVARVTVFVLIAILSMNLIFDAADSHLTVGTLVPVGGLPDSSNDASTFIHLACSPAGTHGPVVLIEAGETSGEDMHNWVQRAEGIKAVCYWDRPGLGLSDNSPSPIGVDATVTYLLSALETEIPSFREERLLLVSHGVGALYSRVFANKVAEQVAGLMLVDALHEEQFYASQTALHGLREFVRGVMAPLSTTKLQGVLKGLGAEERLFGLLTRAQPRLHKALLQQQVSANQRSRLDISLATSALPRDTPVLVVSSAEMCNDKQWNRYQRLLLKLTDRVVAWKILEGPHNLWWNKAAEKDLTAQLEAFVAYVK